MNIVILDAMTLGESDLGGLEQLGSVTRYETTQQKDVIKRAKDADIILTNKVVLDADTMKQLKNLKLICVTATGMNNIDLKCAKRLNIEVMNVAGYSTESVAQHTFMLVLNLLGRLSYYDKYIKKGKWAKSEIFCHLSSENEIYELKNKQWGIIGFGAIGQQVAKIAKSFGANVKYYSTSGKNKSKDFPRARSPQDLLKISDIVSIHAPLNNKTKNLITKKELSLLKKDAILVNVGRGGIVNENDVAKAIKNQDFYYACDVLETEPMSAAHPFLDKKVQKKILITPHIAWAYKETRARLIHGVENNIKSFVKTSSKKTAKTSRAVAKPAAKSSTKVATKTNVKKPARTVASKAVMKPATKAVMKPSTKAVVKTNAKPVAKTNTRPSAKSSTQNKTDK